MYMSAAAIPKQNELIAVVCQGYGHECDNESEAERCREKGKEQGGGGRNGTMKEGGVKMEGSYEGVKWRQKQREREADKEREGNRNTEKEKIWMGKDESLVLLGFNKLLFYSVFLCKDFHIVLLPIQKSSEIE